MSQTQDIMTLVLDTRTATRLHAAKPVRARRQARVPLTREMLDILPAQLRNAVRRVAAKGGVRLYLVEHPTGVSIEVRNIRRRV